MWRSLALHICIHLWYPSVLFYVHVHPSPTAGQEQQRQVTAVTFYQAALAPGLFKITRMNSNKTKDSIWSEKYICDPDRWARAYRAHKCDCFAHNTSTRHENYRQRLECERAAQSSYGYYLRENQRRKANINQNAPPHALRLIYNNVNALNHFDFQWYSTDMS